MRRRLPLLAPVLRYGVEHVGHATSTSVPLRHRAWSSAFASVDDCLKSLVNHEKTGVPRGAGTDSDAGFDMGRMHRLLRDFGDPHMGYQTIHVSGTKGKGTTVSVLASVLRAAGLKVGTYKSPHVYSVAERIRSVGEDHDESRDVLEVLNKLGPFIEVAQKRECGQLSYFEVLTGLAFEYFRRKNVDFAIIEVGLGGIRDATNVLRPENLEAAVITHIGEEHLDALGGSIETIVQAKAGISHRARPVFCAPNVDRRVSQLLKDALDARGADVVDSVRAEIRLLGYRTRGTTLLQELDINVWMQGEPSIQLSRVGVALIGPHQRENIGTALRLLYWLRVNKGLYLSAEEIRIGLESTRSLGNFEVFAREKGAELVADGAHTQRSAEVLVQTLKETHPNRKLVFIVAMADDKDHHGFLRTVYTAQPLAVFCTQIDVAGSSTRTTRATTLGSAYVPSMDAPRPVVQSSFDLAVKEALQCAVDDNAVVVVTGSLYTFVALRKALLIS